MACGSARVVADSISTSYGTFTIDAAGAWTYNTLSALNQLNAGQGLQPFTDLQAGGSGFAVNKNLGHGAFSCVCGGLSDAAAARAGQSGS